ncbi:MULTISPECIES: hypothetical protein [unclassified Rhodococcus (in: high G+C Gram-positive bacteria)]|uniref:hypothetical protein n=1 Tax=unclassified Rhodococcus (in: high G+C Gram-positive bacteria) TaxID=192944 RepID=UPI00092BD125|nr:hypothetical protein [Rhodococcus sp. M8]OLL16787.1 hypothetical protein BKE56_025985 [Rhodococcus sp. M8]QPG46864.1 hypothetical protein ISO16_07615 [Rhodococcus sp. M8]
MADVDTDPTDPTTGTRRRGPSILMLLSAIAALAVSGWALIGPFSLEPLANVEFRWLLVALAVVVGAALVFAPGKKKR